jgi:hypothetical protein
MNFLQKTIDKCLAALLLIYSVAGQSIGREAKGINESYPSLKRVEMTQTEDEKHLTGIITWYFRRIEESNLIPTVLSQNLSSFRGCPVTNNICDWTLYGNWTNESQPAKRVEIIPLSASNPPKVSYVRIFLRDNAEVNVNILNVALIGKTVLPIVREPTANDCERGDTSDRCLPHAIYTIDLKEQEFRDYLYSKYELTIETVKIANDREKILHITLRVE